MLTDWYSSGWGARPTKDGIDGVNSMLSGNGGSTVPVERLEGEFPILIEAHALMPDTGGAGKYRGALSMYRTYRFLKEGRALIRTCRATTLPYGLAGGCDGTPFRAVLYRGSQETDYPPQMMVDAQVRPEDAIMHLLPGAGGYGDPLERDPAMVLDDVLDEKISPDYARARVWRRDRKRHGRRAAHPRPAQVASRPALKRFAGWPIAQARPGRI